MAIGLGIGIGITIGGGGSPGGSPSPRIVLSSTTVTEAGGLVGTFSVANSEATWSFAIKTDADGKFDIENDDELVAASLDYETKTSHQVTIEATPDVGDPIERTFTIGVTNVIEAPVFLEAPVVTGALDGILTCSTGTLEMPDGAGATFAYQWKDASDDSDLTGETANTLDTQDYIGLEVYCTVTAMNSADSASEDSNTVGPLEEAETPPGPEAPDAFTAGQWSITRGNAQASVTINTLPDNGGASITDVEYRVDGGSWISSGGTGNFNITSLSNGTEYDVELRAVNSVGAGSASDTKSVTPATVPSAFGSGDWSIAAGDEEADVTIGSLPATGGSAITAVEYRLDGGSWVSSGGTTSFTISGLTNDQEYDVELRAVNSVGNGAASDTKAVTPEAAGGGGDALLLESGDYLLLESGDRILLEAA